MNVLVLQWRGKRDLLDVLGGCPGGQTQVAGVVVAAIPESYTAGPGISLQNGLISIDVDSLPNLP